LIFNVLRQEYYILVFFWIRRPARQSVPFAKIAPAEAGQAHRAIS